MGIFTDVHFWRQVKSLFPSRLKGYSPCSVQLQLRPEWTLQLHALPCGRWFIGLQPCSFIPGEAAAARCMHFILITIVLSNVSSGIILAFPGVLNAAILAKNGTDIRATENEASWIAASTGLSGIPSHIILPIIMQQFGRKVFNVTTNFTFLIGWLILVFSQDHFALLLGRIFHGIGTGGSVAGLILTAEYTHPTRRGYFIVAKKLSIGIGILLCHSLHLCWSWRQISGIGVVLSALSTLMTFSWPESPAYLAMKNKFAECEISYTWLYGIAPNNKNELEDLIYSQKAKNNNLSTKPKSSLKKRLLQKDFLKLFFITVCISLLFESSGKHIFPAFLLQIMLKLFGDKSVAAYVTIGNDILTLIALIIAVVIVRYFKRRTLLFTFGTLSVSLMVVIIVILYVKSSYENANLEWWSAFTILLFSFVTNIGVTPVIFAVMGEVFPIDLRVVGVCMAGMVFSTNLAIAFKVTPALIEFAGLRGIFILNSLVSSICLAILRFVLPETKDRTLLDIENEMKGIEKLGDEGKAMLK